MKHTSTNHFKKKKKLFFKILFIILFFLCILFVFHFVDNYNQKEIVSTSTAPTVQEQEETIQEPQTKTITLTAIGDIMCHNTQYRDAYNEDTDTYDFSYVFEDIAPLFQDRDIVIGNLETTFAGENRGYSSYPTFNTPEQLATDLKELGIDVVSTANNHSLDTGYSGLVSTLDTLDEVGVAHMGTYRSEEEQNQVLLKEFNGLKVAFLSYTYGTNGIPVPSGKDYCINLIDTDLISSQITKAKEQNADIIIANVHWGTEYRTSPTDQQEELANFLFENGVDIILGSHPHVLEPMEVKKVTTTEGEEKIGFVIYSLGNFMSGQTKENTRDSIILNLTISKKGDEPITIDEISYIPIYCYTGNGDFKEYKLLDIRKNLESYEKTGTSLIPASKISFFQEELNKITNLMDSRLEKAAS